jgi:hypothetical protein
MPKLPGWKRLRLVYTSAVAVLNDDDDERLKRIEQLLQRLAEELGSLREEGRVVSENLRDSSRAASKRSAAAKRAAERARTSLQLRQVRRKRASKPR